jgi:hypothetical protein
MRENRTYGSEGGGTETNRFSLPLSGISSSAARLSTHFGEQELKLS